MTRAVSHTPRLQLAMSQPPRASAAAAAEMYIPQLAAILTAACALHATCDMGLPGIFPHLTRT